MSELPDFDWDWNLGGGVLGISGIRPDGAEVGILGIADDLLEGAIGYYAWLNGHGPADLNNQKWGHLLDDQYAACDIPECFKCIRDYKRDLNFPRCPDEEEIFV